jgi:hypothetical protein
MDRRIPLAAARLSFGLLTFFAIGVQAKSLIDAGAFAPVNFFSYFTILSNLLGAALLLVGAVRWRSGHTARIDLLRGAAVVYLIVTFVVVILFLSGAELSLAIGWVDDVLHKVIPIVVVIDWLADPPAGRLTMRQGLLWLIFPAVWLVYTLIRGPIAAWYPYPFLDPAHGGYGSVAVYSIGILIGFLVLSALVLAVGNALTDRRQGAPNDPNRSL